MFDTGISQGSPIERLASLSQMRKGDSRDIQMWQESCIHTWFGRLEMGYKIFAKV